MELANIICPKIARVVLVHKIWYIYTKSKKIRLTHVLWKNVKSENIFDYKQVYTEPGKIFL